MPLTATYQPVLSIAAVIEPLTIVTPAPTIPVPPPPVSGGPDVFGGGAMALGGSGTAATGTVGATVARRAPRSRLSLMALPIARRLL